MIEAPYSQDVVFFKHMAKQLLPDSDWSWVRSTRWSRHVLLLRHPLPVLRSFHAAMIAPGHVQTLQGLRDSGIGCMERIFEHLSRGGSGERLPVVILNEDLLTQPEATLRALCLSLDLPFTSRMLRWEEGGVPEEGVWRDFWYQGSHATTGFESAGVGFNSSSSFSISSSSSTTSSSGVPHSRGEEGMEYEKDSRELLQAVEECLPAYQRLRARRLQPRTLATSSHPAPYDVVSDRSSSRFSSTFSQSTAYFSTSCSSSSSSSSSSPPVLPDERNRNIMIHVGGELLPRAEAKVSVFDSVRKIGETREKERKRKKERGREKGR